MITSEDEYNYRLKTRDKREMMLSKKYGCNGLCYGNKFMCPRVEYCEETRKGEFFATLFAIITYLIVLIIANPITWILLYLLLK